GLGEVIEIGSESAADQLNRFRFGGVDPSQSQQQTDFATVGGPVMVVDARSGTLIYYGTPAQHEQLQSLITELDLDADRIVVRPYKLRYANAVEVADLIQALLTGQSVAGDSPFLPGQRQSATAGQGAVFTPFGVVENPGDGDSISFDFDPNRTFVAADEQNNQV